MRVALFVPCFIDAFFPGVGKATLELLERLGCDVSYPLDQTCCGQPLGNSGCERDAVATEALFVKNFTGFDYVVAPSGSCVHHVRDRMTAIDQTEEVQRVRSRTFELVEFLHDVLKVDALHGQNFRIKWVCTTVAERCAACVRRRHRKSMSRRSPSPWIS